MVTSDCDGEVPGKGDVGESIALIARLTWNGEFKIVTNDLIAMQSLIISIHMVKVNCCTVKDVS